MKRYDLKYEIDPYSCEVDCFGMEESSEAQDKFVSYLKSTGVWQHLWQLSFKFEECKILED